MQVGDVIKHFAVVTRSIDHLGTTKNTEICSGGLRRKTNCSLFNDVVGSSGYKMSNDWMIKNNTLERMNKVAGIV
jgi:hypothetical protein